MCVHTSIEIERCKSSSKFETVALLARNLNTNLDAIGFPKTVPASVSMSGVEIQKFISLR